MSKRIHVSVTTEVVVIDGKEYGPLRLPQVRVLKALASAKEPQTKAQIAAKLKVSIKTVNAGLCGKKAGQGHETAGYPGLGTLKLVEEVNPKEYQITTAGRKALETALKHRSGKLPSIQAGPSKKV